MKDILKYIAQSIREAALGGVAIILLAALIVKKIGTED